MFKNYFTVAIRSLWKNGLYTGLNIAGLTFGITCFFIIGLYLFDELTFDHQHQNADRIYRVVQHKNVNGEETTIAAAGYQLSEESKKNISEVENTSRLSRLGRANLVDPENPVNIQETVTTANQNFLDIFDFPFLSGDRNTALKEPNSIIINEDLAKRLFNKTDVLGKKLKFSFMDPILKITGVFKNHPRNSSFDFNNLLSDASNPRINTDWMSTNYSVYYLLKPNSNADIVSKKMKDLVLANFKPSQGTTFSFSLQALKDLHLKSEHIVDGARNTNVEAIALGNPLYIKIFSYIALFVLLIAGINYMNLSTARATYRTKEIGIRKSIGALRSNLVIQFLFEAILVTAISLLLAIFLVNVILPAFNQFTNKQLSLGFNTDQRIWFMVIASVVVIGLLSGSYPAVLLSGFKPTSLIKGMKINNSGSMSLRKGLIVFQFTISTVMILATIVLFLQVRYLNTTNLGFNKDLLVVIDVNTNKARTNFESIKNEIAKIPTVKSVSATSRVPGEWKSFRMVKVKNAGNMEDPKVAYLFGADQDFMKTFQVDLLKGRNFTSIRDSNSIIINETSATLLNISRPSDQLVEIPSVSQGGEFTPLNAMNVPFKPRVVGIVKDFHFQSLRDKIEPLILAYHLNPVHNIDYYTARIEATDITGTLAKLKAVMVNNDKDDPFEYHFLNDQLALFYIEDYRRQTLLIWIALSTIFIACLGLFGLATYAAEQRIKDIGVRKVLGATVFNLATLQSKDFLKLVSIAIIIAIPIAWLGANRWLQEYAYHIEIKWWMFAIGGMVAIVIALLTVSYQAIKASRMNPVKALRTE